MPISTRILRSAVFVSRVSHGSLTAIPRRLFATAVKKATTMDYETILKGKYPAKAHAKRVADYIRSKKPNAEGVLYLEGRMTKLLEDNDEPEPFRQRRYFYYLSGCNLADCHLIHDMATSKTTLFIPPIDPDSVVWSGLPVSPAEALGRYDVDEVLHTTEVNATLARLGAAGGDGSTVFAIPAQVSDHITFLEFGAKDFSLLKPAIERCRVVKSPYERALIAKANAVTAAAHRAVMARVRSAATEQELDAVFLGSCVAAGARNQAYHGIVASGTAAATLHYVHNDAPLQGKLNLLLDAGAEWDCYAADVTRTFPINGTFTPESRTVYDTVQRMQLECIKALRAGVRWEDMHLLAHTMAAEGLLAAGILKGASAEELVKNRTTVAFFPHGLGHYLGMDTHDTGGDADYSDPDPMFRYLRVRGTLPAGSVITVEPGVYFCRFIIEPYLKDSVHAKYIDAAVLEKYWEVGGVRIEDNVVITETGCENLTTAIKDVNEMEKVIKG